MDPGSGAMIPAVRLDLGPDELDAVASVFRAGRLAGGDRVAELEERWAHRFGTRHAVAMSSGTAAIMALLAGLGIGPGDEVITVAFTSGATINAILSTGATPVFVDVEPDTYLLDAKRVEERVTSRTAAIVPVHLFGLVADMDMIQAIADRYGLAVIEDACQAPGGTFRGRAAGSFGHGAFSFGATSAVASGEGGIATTGDDALAAWLRLYRDQGGREGSPADILGFNFRLSDVAAAIALCQLDKLDGNIHRRQATARAYDEAFDGLSIRTPVTPVGRRHVFHRYAINVGSTRDVVAADLASKGVEAPVPYPVPLHRQPYAQERGLHADLPVTDAVAAETLCLPMFAGLGSDEERHVIAAVTAVAESAGGVTLSDRASSAGAATR